jgi:hypothetical protein
MSRTRALALCLATGLAFQACASTPPRKPPLRFSQRDNGIAVHAEPVFDPSPEDEAALAGMTRVTVSLENVEQWVAAAPGADIAIEFPDGSRFLAMPPEEARPRVEAQRERRRAPVQDQAVQPPPDAPGASTTKAQVAAGVLTAVCLPAWLSQAMPPLMLFTAPPCLLTLAIVYPMLPKQPKPLKPPSDAQRRRSQLNDGLHALRHVELMRGETATALLYFSVANEVVRDVPGAALVVPFVDAYRRDLGTVRVPLTPSRP